MDMDQDQKFDPTISDDIEDITEPNQEIIKNKFVPVIEKKEVKVRLPWEDEEIIIETGKWAKQAHGSVVYKCGKGVSAWEKRGDKEKKSFGFSLVERKILRKFDFRCLERGGEIFKRKRWRFSYYWKDGKVFGRKKWIEIKFFLFRFG
jgi:hypothetical protein